MKLSEVLNSQDNWQQCLLAANAEGRSVSVLSAECCRCCLLGAIAKATAEGDDANRSRFTRVCKLTKKVICKLGFFKGGEWADYCSSPGAVIVTFNDEPTTTFDMVRQVVEEVERQYADTEDLCSPAR